MEKHRNKFFTIFVLVGTVIATALIFIGTHRIQQITDIPQSLASSHPTPTPDENIDITIPSPDGKYELGMVNTKKSDGTITQTFTAANLSDKSSVNVYSYIAKNKDDLLSIPFNCFSPNNKYMMLSHEDGGQTKHIVLRTDGQEIAKGGKYVEVENSFYNKYSDFDITDVTGWGGYSLLLVNTNFKDGKVGPSWWFDTSNLSFIRLSTRFN
jgi:hypothetical protein